MIISLWQFFHVFTAFSIYLSSTKRLKINSWPYPNHWFPVAPKFKRSLGAFTGYSFANFIGAHAVVFITRSSKDSLYSATKLKRKGCRVYVALNSYNLGTTLLPRPRMNEIPLYMSETWFPLVRSENSGMLVDVRMLRLCRKLESQPYFLCRLRRF